MLFLDGESGSGQTVASGIAMQTSQRKLSLVAAGGLIDAHRSTVTKMLP